MFTSVGAESRDLFRAIGLVSQDFQRSAKATQPPALAWADHHPLAQLAAQDLILPPQALNLADQVALDGFAQECK